MEPELDILFQDEHYVAVNKPAGVLVHRSKLDRRAPHIALQMVRDMMGRHVYPVHRLDKPTSGVLLFALSPEAANLLMTLFAERKTAKKYQAVVRGFVESEIEIDYALKEIRDKKTDSRARQNKPAQEAQTHIYPLSKTELPYPVGRYQTCRYTLVDVQPKTGRQHQIRRHMKHIFHPILGDRKYGDWRHNRFLQDHFGCERMLLHASHLSFDHPVSGKPTSISAPPDNAYLAVINELFNPFIS